ncbi:MAG: MBL fold metallo-hydrolase [Clostridia bacterium]|nr:MBL fold metallo-hydrolase [Clostridia bacterium]
MARRKKMTKKQMKKLKPLMPLIITIVVILAIVYALWYFGIIDIPYITLPGTSTGTGTESTTTNSTTKNDDVTTVVSGDLIINFMELGNWYTGDSTFIKAGDVDILIDAGSRENSISTICETINKYCTDGKLEYVIITHNHEDHIAGFATSTKKDSIFDLYECGTIIDFALTNAKETQVQLANYQRELNDEIANGAKHYTARELRESGNYTFELSEGITMTILDNYYYYNTSSSENNYSVCTLITQGDRNFLFTGDLESGGEKKLVESNNLPTVEVFKGGHHGSGTSNTTALFDVIQPKNVCICCCAGSNEYTKNESNQFPTQEAIDRIARYTKNVYVTTISLDNSEKTFAPMNGTIVVSSFANLPIQINCSNNNTLLKDTDWFKNNRICPKEWAE